jgi:NADH-quinone oxidoreductase subunit B
MDLGDKISKQVLTTKLEALIRWSRKHSLWPMPFGTACCAIEPIRFSPRQSDLMIVAGRVCIKMMPVLQRIYLQMPEPKWVIAMGACASSGGVFDTYSVIQGIDNFMPVDVYIPGCPPRPEAIIESVISIQERITEERQVI